MTVIVFLLDNTASAAQKSYVGISFIDFARQFVESFLKVIKLDRLLVGPGSSDVCIKFD